MELTEKAGRYEITKAGGAGQIGDKNSGKLGQTLFSGEWRFQVVSVETVDTYKPEFNQEWVAKPKQGETLVVVHCRVKNGTMKKETIAFERDAEAVTRHGILNNALTDANEQAFSPIATDGPPGQLLLWPCLGIIPAGSRYSVQYGVQRTDGHATEERSLLCGPRQHRHNRQEACHRFPCLLGPLRAGRL